MKPRTIIYIVFVVVLLTSPLYLNRYWVDVLNNIGLYAVLGLSLNIIVGHTGLFNLGHAAFYAVGAYTAAILNTRFDIPIILLLPVCALTAGIFAVIIARPIIHLRGDYLCIVTIGIGEIVRIALINDIFGITGGANGIFGIDRPSLFGLKIKRTEHFFYYIWIFAGITVYLYHRLEQSRFGRALNYLREDEIAAEGSGIDTSHYKLAAFVLGAAWAGMVGNIYASKMMIISPESFSFWESVLMFTLIILGGSGSIPGVILGAFLVVGMPEVFRGLDVVSNTFNSIFQSVGLDVDFKDFAKARMLIFGAAMIIMMIFRTQGIIPPLPRSFPIEEKPTSEESS